jgi:rhodanese-related sulfurtransferase
MSQTTFMRIDADRALYFMFDACESGRAYALFDAREPEAYAKAHLPGAELLTQGSVGAWAERIPREQPVLVYCYHGNISQALAKMFADAGFGEVYSVDGGYHDLLHAYQRAYKLSELATRMSEPLRAFLVAEKFPRGGLDTTIDNGTTPLMRAARFGKRALVEELVALGAKLEPKNADGNTALWLACFSGDLDVVSALIEAGANLDNQNDNGATCLMYAASSGKADLVALLLAAGANAELQNFDDFRALDLASTIDCLRLLRPSLGRAAFSA